jgi:hypothetical protein
VRKRNKKIEQGARAYNTPVIKSIDRENWRISPGRRAIDEAHSVEEANQLRYRLDLLEERRVFGQR